MLPIATEKGEKTVLSDFGVFCAINLRGHILERSGRAAAEDTHGTPIGGGGVAYADIPVKQTDDV